MHMCARVRKTMYTMFREYSPRIHLYFIFYITYARLIWLATLDGRPYVRMLAWTAAIATLRSLVPIAQKDVACYAVLGKTLLLALKNGSLIEYHLTYSYVMPELMAPICT